VLSQFPSGGAILVFMPYVPSFTLCVLSQFPSGGAILVFMPYVPSFPPVCVVTVPQWRCHPGVHAGVRGDPADVRPSPLQPPVCQEPEQVDICLFFSGF